MPNSMPHFMSHKTPRSIERRPAKRSFARSGMKALAVFLALAMPLALTLAEAEARVGGGGSRGSRTFSAPPSTRTAPNAARPIERTITQPSTPSAGQASSGIGSSSTQRPGGFFNRPGLLGGLAAGFLGAGLFGMLSGNGFFGGIGSLMSFLGLIIQIVLVVIVARLIWSWWQRRNAPSYAGARPGASGDMAFRDGGPGGMNSNAPGGSGLNSSLNSSLGGALGGMFGGGAANAAPQGAPQGTPIEIDEADYNAFEKLLGDIQSAWSNEDIGVLRTFATPEMVSYFSEDMTANAGRGVVNKVSDVKLLQGDLAEAWREDRTDYATVAMHFALIDKTIERASGRVVEGSDTPQEVTEVWTFRRDNGGKWMLSAIQGV